MRIETTSSMAVFATCPRKYKYQYVDLLQSNTYSSALGFGTFVHAFIETLKPGGDPAAATRAVETELAKYKSQQLDHYRETEFAIAADYGLAREVAKAWKEYWDRFDGHILSNQALEFTETEKEWAFKIGGNTLVGKRDGLIHHKDFKKYFLHEVKTSGDANRETYKLKLQQERQISNNIMAIREEGKYCEGVVYDIIWKPAIRQKKDESSDEFQERKAECYRAEPERYFERLIVYRSDQDLKNAMTNLQQNFAMMGAGKMFGYPKNETACEKWGTLCPFFSAGCMDEMEPQGFEVREQKFPEISASFQSEVANATQCS